jgi:hypothetical protein
MTLEEIADRLLQYATRMYTSGTRNTVILPLLHVETIDGKVAAVGLPWGSPKEKTEQLETARRMMKRLGAIRYGIIAEAWAAHYDPQEPVARPSLRRNRTEIISIATADRSGKSYCVAYKIERDAKGRPSIGEKQTIGKEGDTVTTIGRMVTLLEEPHEADVEQ